MNGVTWAVGPTIHRLSIKQSQTETTFKLDLLTLSPCILCTPLLSPTTSPSAEGDRFLKSQFLQKKKKKKNELPHGPNSCRRETSQRSPPVHNVFHMLTQEPRGTLYLTSGTDHLCLADTVLLRPSDFKWKDAGLINDLSPSLISWCISKPIRLSPVRSRKMDTITSLRRHCLK